MPNSNSLGPLGRPSKNRFRSTSLGAAAASVASAGLADSAAATIIYDLSTSHPTGTTMSFDPTTLGDLDLINWGIDDSLTLEAALDMAPDPDSTVQISIFSFDNGVGMFTDFVNLLAPGDTVDGSLDFDPMSFMAKGNLDNPIWAAGLTGYTGFVFDNGSGPQYGWLQIEFAADGSDFTVKQWAYEDTPNTPIDAGVIPEPSTALLLGIGLVGLAAGLGRKRRPIVSEDS